MRDTGDDLSIRARRGELDEDLTKQLGLLLNGSLEARLAHRAGCEFDAEASVLPGDHALAERISERLLRARPFAPPLKPSFPPWMKALLGATALAAVAAALLFANRAPRVRPARVGVAIAAPSAVAAPSASALPVLALQGSAPSVEPVVLPQPAGPGRERARAASAAPRVAPPLAENGLESPAALFARANRARRETDSPRAVALYERLQRRFPNSPEALASEIPLGLLKLSLGQASGALPHFAAYLERAPNGELGPEALWGQAQALFALGRSESARQALRLLLSKHPESAYAGAARAKLQAQQ